MADARGESLERLARATRENTQRLFALK